jgi:hypothetical protein
MFYSKEWKAGDKFKITVKYNWKNGADKGPSPDYTVQAYSLQKLEIFDLPDDESDRKTNKINMDGSCPSGLVGTDFSYCKSVHAADLPQPVKKIDYLFLADVFENASWDTFIIIILSNPKLVLPIYWFDWFGLLIGSS